MDEESLSGKERADSLFQSEKSIPASTEVVEESVDAQGSVTTVSFDGPDDPTNPLNWSPLYKWSLVGLISCMNLCINLGTLICAPAAPSIMSDLGAHNPIYLTLLVSLWELGEACGPLIMAPASELFGRAPVYHIANSLFVLFSIGGALAPTVQTVIAFRFLQGITVASVVLDPSVVGDLFAVEQRGKAMSLRHLVTLIGPIAGPVIGGYVSQTIGWRWTFWIPAIMGGCCEIGFALFFRETYKVQLISRKVKKLRKENPEFQYESEYKELGAAARLRTAIVRPFVMLFLSPVLLIVSLYSALVFGYLYLLFTSVEEAFQTAYAFSTGEASFAYLAIGIGLAAGIFVCQKTLDKLLKTWKGTSDNKAEARLPPMVVGGAIIPISLLMYGWTIQVRTHWIAPMIGLALYGFGVAVTFVPAFIYLVDAFGTYAASALAASITLRCVTGALAPLAGPALYGHLQQGWGNTVLALISVAMLPVPLLLMKYGERLRRSSKFEVRF